MGEFWVSVAEIVVPILGLGVFFVLMSRWSRKKNLDLKQEFGSASQQEALRAIRDRQWRKYVRFNFFGDVDALGTLIAVVVVIVSLYLFIFHS